MAEQVVIEFIADTSKLQPVEDVLASQGKIDQASAAIFKQTNEQLKQRNAILDSILANTEKASLSVSKEQVIYNKLVVSLKNLSGASKEAVQTLLKMSAGDIAQGFREAAVEVDDYIAVLEDAEKGQKSFGDSADSIRQQLKEVSNELAALIFNGVKEGEEFEALSLKAGKLKNALAGTQQTIGTLGQNVPVLKVLGAGMQTVAAGVSAATSATALFGGESKDLEKVLVKVNAAMALSAAISQIVTALNDAETLSTAKTIALKTVNNAKTIISNALESESIIIRTAATVAQYALNLAMSLSPVGWITIGLAAFVVAIGFFTSNAREAAKAQAELNGAMSEAGDILDAGIEATQRSNKRFLADLDERNARESEKQHTALNALKSINQQRLDAIDELNASIEKNQHSTDSDTQDLVKKALERRYALEKDAADGRTEIYEREKNNNKQILVEQLEDQQNLIQARLTLAKKNSDRQFELERQLVAAKSALELNAAGDDERKKQAIRAQSSRDIKDIDIAQQKVRDNEILALRQAALIRAQNASRAINDRTSQEEIDAQIKVIQKETNIALKEEGLKENKRRELILESNQKISELQQNFSKQAILNVLADQISANNAVLAQVNLSEKERLSIRIENIILSASAEIEQNKGKIQKIKEIEAKRDVDIRDARLKSIEETSQKEIALVEATEAESLRAIQFSLSQQARLRNATDVDERRLLEKTIGVRKKSLADQLKDIDVLYAAKKRTTDAQLFVLDEEFRKGLISEKDYNLKRKQLIDKNKKDHEDAEHSKTDTTEEEISKRIEKEKKTILFITDVAAQAVTILQSIYQQDGEAAQARIDAQRKSIQDLSDAGAITAKEASARNKKLDIEQRQLQLQQAKRDKQIALFNAIISTAAGIAKAIPDPFLIVLAAAIGAAQIAIIASRPLPQFGKGKKGNFEGLAEVGETGPELVRRGGRMYLEDKPTVTWLSASDKVYNPTETAAMIEARIPSNYYPGMATASTKSIDFDYERMGRAVGDNIPQYGIGFDEHGLYEYQQSKNSFTKYLYQRRKWGSK